MERPGEGWSQEQINNARIIINTGKQLGASNRDIQIALMTGLVESGLRNLSYGDRDSVGVFQQRSAWGSYAQRTNVAESARMFFEGGHAGQRGLFDFANRNEMSMGQAAQAVQVSAFPDRYAQQQGSAAAILKSLGVPTSSKGTLGEVPGLTVTTRTVPMDLTADPMMSQPSGPSVTVNPMASVGSSGMDNQSGDYGVADSGGPLDGVTFGSIGKNPMADYMMPTLDSLAAGADGAPSATTATMPTATGAGAEGWRKRAVQMARQMLGTPYVWGGEDHNGVDCSGLVQLIYKQLGFNLPRVSMDQARSGQRISLKDLRPGDLVAWDNSTRNQGADHISIYIGNGEIIEAPHPGGQVQVSHLYDTGQAWGVRMNKGG